MALTKNNIDNVNTSALSKFQGLTEKIKPYLNDWRLSSALVILLLASSGTAYYFYSKTVTTPAEQQAAARAESKALVAQIGQLIVLPNNEEPTVATVSNVEVLKSQPFFANAKNGDRVLIYANARKAVLFDPVSNKIVEVAPIVIGNPAPAAPVK